MSDDIEKALESAETSFRKMMDCYFQMKSYMGKVRKLNPDEIHELRLQQLGVEYYDSLSNLPMTL